MSMNDWMDAMMNDALRKATRQASEQARNATQGQYGSGFYSQQNYQQASQQAYQRPVEWEGAAPSILKIADGETAAQAADRVKLKVHKAMQRLKELGWRGVLEIGQGKQSGGEVYRYRFTGPTDDGGEEGETIGQWEINAPRALVRVAEEVLADGD